MRGQLVHVTTTVLLNELGGVDVDLLVRVDRHNDISNKGLKRKKKKKKKSEKKK